MLGDAGVGYGDCPSCREYAEGLRFYEECASVPSGGGRGKESFQPLMGRIGSSSTPRAWGNKVKRMCSRLHAIIGLPALHRHGVSREAAMEAVMQDMAKHFGQLPELKYVVKYHFRSLPLSYMAALFRSEKVLQHVQLLAETADLPSGTPAVGIEMAEPCSYLQDVSCDDKDEDQTFGFGTSSCSSSGSDDTLDTQGTILEIAFACDRHTCRHAIAVAFQRVGMRLRKILVYQTRSGHTLGVVVAASAGLSKSEIEKVVHDAVKRSSRRARVQPRKLPADVLGFLRGKGLPRVSSSNKIADSSWDARSEGTEPLADAFDVDPALLLPHGILRVLVKSQSIDVAAHAEQELGKCLLDSSKLEIGAKIAAGSSSEVCRGSYEGEDVAVKILRGCRGAKSVMAEFRREVLALSSCAQCQYLLPLHGVCVDSRQRLCIVTKFMKGGSVLDLLSGHGKGLELAQVLQIAADTAQGMQYLHEHGIIHRDLKTANIFLDSAGRARVGDLGVARLQEERGEMTMEVGTYRWMAPEALGAGTASVSHKSDVYSFGIVLWELATGCIPYSDYTPVQAAVGVALSNLRPAIPEHTPAPLQALMARCWDRNPRERPEFSEIVDTLHDLRLETS